MKIFVSHSNDFDYQNGLYVPLRNSSLNNKHEIFLPHENEKSVNTKDIIKDSDLIIAEVSYSATGLGIELGWADSFSKPIVCIYKEGNNTSNSLKSVTGEFISYSNSEDLVKKLVSFLEKFDSSEG